MQRPQDSFDVDTLKKSLHRPTKVVVTAGMPYANGPLHLGHLAGAHLPADIFARWMRMLVGPENVLFVCGSDEHGSTSELTALTTGRPIREIIDEVHDKQASTLKRYGISLDAYSGTSQPEAFETHRELSQEFFRKLERNGMLEKRVSRQWYDTVLGRFLQDRFVRGHCPNPKCDNDAAYSEECDRCGSHYDPAELKDPRSALNDSTPVLKDTKHWALDMSKVSEPLRVWLETKKDLWRTPVYNEVINTVLPTLSFDKEHEDKYKAEFKQALPKHKSRYAPGKRVALQFGNKQDYAAGEAMLRGAAIPTFPVDEWAHREITRDVAWGVPLPLDIDPELEGKTLYVWPDSLIAPISFSKVALAAKGQDPERYSEFWKDPQAKIYQFFGVDNVFFYVLMQGSMWLGTQEDTQRMPRAGEFQLSEVFGSGLLQINGQKMSKSTGNFFTGDQLLDEMGFSADQIRYALALLGLSEGSSNFELGTLQERNRFLAGPMNAAFERPISACRSKFGGKVPAGALNEKVQAETYKILKSYFRSMGRAEYHTLLFAIENYARQVNSLFTQFKPHDDRHPEGQRADALYSCFFVLKNIMIMLYPFAPETMDSLRRSLRLPESVFRVEELGTGIEPGHEVGEKGTYFPAVAEA